MSELNPDSNNVEEIMIKDTSEKTEPSISEDIYEMRERIQETLEDKDTPQVTVLVMAYNKLEEYTKQCVECILKYTDNVDYELILIDNGSSDGTFEFFKSVQHPRKKIIRITKNLGMFYGGLSGLLEWKGKYIVTVANDILVTTNWLYNMIKCAESDPKIGIVSPTSDNISNFQNAEWEYKDYDDMQIKAAQNNKSDPCRWEERMRIVSLGTLYKRSCWNMMGQIDYGFIHDFSDDDIAFRARRAGYKVVLCKDSFVSHVGKITDKGIQRANESLKIGRETFRQKYYGIDAWEDCNNFEMVMMSVLEKSNLNPDKQYNILGIDVRCGTPILQAKNKLRVEGVFDVKLSAFTEEAKYWLDLHTICEGQVNVDRIEHIGEYFDESSFDYIIIGKPLNEYQMPEKAVVEALSFLGKDGQLLVKVDNDKNMDTLLQVIHNTDYPDKYCTRFNIGHLRRCIEAKGAYIANIEKEIYISQSEQVSQWAETIMNMNKERQTQEVVNQLITNDYVVSIKRR